MASVERTAYPRFRRLVTARELATLTPSEAEIRWARERTRSDQHLLALTVTLKCFQRLGYFPPGEEVPSSIVDQMRRCLDLPEGTPPVAGARTAKAHRELVRSRSGATHDPERARAVAAEAIRTAAASKNNPADLINVALEMLVRASLELPAYSTLDEMASRIRREVNTATFEGIVARMPLPDRVRLEGLLDVAGPGAKSDFSRLTAPAGRASWSEFREQWLACAGWTPSATPSGGWKKWPSPRSRTSPGRRRPRTPV